LEGGQALEEVDQRGCQISVFGDIQNLTGHSPGCIAVDGPCFEQGERSR